MMRKTIEKVQKEEEDVCEKCKNYKHEEDFETEEKQLMKKKKSHLRKKKDFEWIGCNNCDCWFHQKCSGLEPFEYEIYEKFHCSSCVSLVGPSVEYPKVSPHRLNWFEKDEIHEKREIGSEKWIRDFCKWEMHIPKPTEEEFTICNDGHEFLKKFEKDGGNSKWSKVYLIKKKNGLKMKIPNDFQLKNVIDVLGEDYEVDTIDVFRQITILMKLSTFSKILKQKVNERKRIYNFLSLEFSDNPTLSQLLKPPQIVMEMSMIEHLWPPEGSPKHLILSKNGELLDEEEKPRVLQYLLVGMAFSYTDFHVDFGGSSVFYHVLEGIKVFYIVPPTEENLKKYLDAQLNGTTEDWFGDNVFSCLKRVIVRKGETLLIPSGWIHAVLTLVDSIVFGGNFLHIGNIPMQLKVHRLETEIQMKRRIDTKFLFPNFRYIHWFTVRNELIGKIETANEKNQKMNKTDESSWNAISSLLIELKIWIEEEKKTEKTSDLPSKRALLGKLEKNVKIQMEIQSGRGNSNKKKNCRMEKEIESDDDYVPSATKRKR